MARIQSFTQRERFIERSLILGEEGAFIQREEEGTFINSDGSNNLTEMALPRLAERFGDKHSPGVNTELCLNLLFL